MHCPIHRLLFPLMLVALLIDADAEDTVPAQHLAFITLTRQFDGPDVAVSAVDMTSDGKWGLTLCAKKICVWDLNSGVCVLTCTPEGSDHYQSAVFAPDGMHIAVGAVGESSGILLLDAVSGKEVRRYTGHEWGTGCVAMSPDGRLIAGCSGSGYSITARQTIIWDVASGIELTRIEAGNGDGLAFSPDSRTLAICGYHFARLYDAHSGALVRDFADNGESSLTFSADGKKIAIMGKNGLCIRDVATGKSVFTLPVGRNSVGRILNFYAARFLSGDKQLLTIGGGLRLWDITSGAELSWALDPHRDALHDTAICLAMSQDGRFALTDDVRKDGDNFSSKARLWTLPRDTRTANPLPPPLRGDVTMRPTPPLTLALKIGDMARVKAMLARGADVRAMEGSTDTRGATAICYAVGNLELIKEMLDRGHNLESVCDGRNTVLCLAVNSCALAYTNQKNDEAAAALKIVEFLVGRGADVNVDPAFPLLRAAAHYRHRALAELLIAHGAEWDFTSMVLLGDLERMTRMLADDPGLAHRLVNRDKTPLYFARTAPALDLLFAHGAQIEAKDGFGRTTVSRLLDDGITSLEQVILLQARGADMQTKSQDGRTSIERLHDIERQISEARSKR